jgi:hypothetical protein
MKGGFRGLDPLLAPALKLTELPVIPARQPAEDVATLIVGALERLAPLVDLETDVESQAQLGHVLEALGACTISLLAYARGRVPKVSNKPNANIIVQN